MNPGVSTEVEPQAFRQFMASVVATVSVVTVADAHGLPGGVTVSSLASLSLEPAMISIALDNRSSILGRLLDAQRFGVNTLCRKQSEIARVFASRAEDRFAGIDWRMDGGLPRLTGALGWMACTLDRSVAAGDHTLLLGRADRAVVCAGEPLIYGFRTFGTHTNLPADQLMPRYLDTFAE